MAKYKIITSSMLVTGLNKIGYYGEIIDEAYLDNTKRLLANGSVELYLEAPVPEPTPAPEPKRGK
jgi:hypothetical protein